MEKYEYIPNGVCSKRFEFEIENDIIVSLAITGGCPGNLVGISNIVKGKSLDEVIKAFEGIPCGAKPTSCPDQIAKALRYFQIHYKKDNRNKK